MQSKIEESRKSDYQCKTWTEHMEGFGEVERDSHKWIELLNTKELQTLKCELCGKHSTAKHTKQTK